jgi:HPt (histidine-containing phosphotransfer) domain-containing protein
VIFSVASSGKTKQKRKEGIMNLANVSTPPINLEEAKSRVLGDMHFLQELLITFAESIPETIDRLDRSLADQDGRMLSRTAHQLKGTALNLGAVRIAEAASALNELGRREDYPTAARTMEALKESVAELKAFIQQDLSRALDAKEDGHENTHCG